MIEPIARITGTVVPLMHANIDTDQIMPKQYLKRVERAGFGAFVFANWRAAGDFVLDDPRFAGASVLVAGDNFGCGSSREQAVWGLLDHGFAAVVAPSFGPIFAQNAARSRLLTVQAPPPVCARIAALAQEAPSTVAAIDVATAHLTMADIDHDFEVDERTRRAFVDGVDEIDRTIGRDAAITAYEQRRHSWLPETPQPAARRRTPPAQPGR